MMVTQAAFKITFGLGNYKGGCLMFAEELSASIPPAAVVDADGSKCLMFKG